MSEPNRAWLDQMNQPCSEPGHERMPDPDRPGKTKCRTCKQAIVRRSLQRIRDRLRSEVLAAYGRACACCGESREVFLVIDHIEGGGNEHRREIKAAGGGTGMYRWLRKNGWPAGFQTLCHNCNYAKHRLGECPHQTERSEGGRS